MQSPTVGHFQSVLRYVKGTLTHGLFLSLGSFELNAFSDFNLAGDVHDRISTSSYCIFLGNNLTSWSAKIKQPTVFHSSTEAEYRSLAQIVAELSWLQMLLTDRGLSSNSVFPAHSNISAD